MFLSLVSSRADIMSPHRLCLLCDILKWIENILNFVLLMLERLFYIAITFEPIIQILNVLMVVSDS